MRNLGGCALLLFAGAVACDDESAAEQATADLAVGARVVDFGEVQIGRSAGRRIVSLRNNGTTLLQIESVVPGEPFDAETFSFEIDRFDLAPGVTAILTADFAPTRLGEQSGVIAIRARSAGRELPVELTLRGEGISSDLVATPRQLDFGNVLVNTQKTLAVSIGNPSRFRADVDYLAGGNVSLCDDREGTAFCIRAVDRDFDDDRAFRVGASETVDVEVVFRPSVVNTQERGGFALRYCPLAECELDIELVGFSVERGFACEPRTLDFGSVNPGSCRELPIRCANRANELVSVTGWSLRGGSSTDFRVERFTPAVLQPDAPGTPGGFVDVRIEYCPQELGDDEGTLRVVIDDDDPLRAETLVGLRGTGGGPDIEVAPSQLSFGLVSLRAPSRRTVLVTNAGFEDLLVENITADARGIGAFTSPDAGAVVIPSGRSEAVQVNFQPVREGPIETRLVIQSNDRDEPEVEVLMRGEGIDLPPCDFQISERTLNFGTVQTSRAARGAFEIRNRSTTSPCLVNGVGLGSGTDPAYSLPEPYDSVLIPPESALAISVAFAPERPGRYEGTVQFSISSPDRPLNTVNLVGQAAGSSLLIVPNDLFYGTIPVGCSARAKTVTMYNTGAVIATIDTATISAQPGVFSFADLPAVPFTIAPGASVQFEVTFFAPRESDFAGRLELGGTFEGQPVTYVIAMQGRGSVDAVQVDRFVQLGRPSVDILFVVDNSCSMGAEQQSLADNFESFIQFAEARALDYHIAVTTTDVRVERGRFVPLTGPASDRVVTPRTQPSPEAVFIRNVVLGTTGGVPESGLEGAYLALSSPLITTHNSGFLRREAVLSLIFVSDEADGSSKTVDFYSNFFRSIKGFRNSNQFSVSAILATEGGGCVGPRPPWEALRYQTIQEQTGGVFGDICTNDWGSTLEDLSTTAFGFKSRFFLTNQPVIQTIEVFIDDVRLAASEQDGRRNWTYDFASNAIDFTPLAVPEPGAEIRIEYTSQCL